MTSGGVAMDRRRFETNRSPELAMAIDARAESGHIDPFPCPPVVTHRSAGVLHAWRAA
jgi:hypothetical protein